MRKVLMAFMFCLGIAVLLGNTAIADEISPDFKIADDGSRITVNPQVGNGTSNRAPGSLTTIFASNNQFAGNTFDIMPAVDLEITALDCNTDPVGAPIVIDVYYKDGTSVGFESNPAPWTLLGSATTTSAGSDNPTNIDLTGNGVTFLAGQTYGIYVDLANYASGVNVLRYTNGQGTYSNSDLSLTTYTGKGNPAFLGSTFTPRQWNGTVYYETGGAGGSLIANPTTISQSTGGTITFTLDAGAMYAGGDYVIVGSVTGNTGVPLKGGAVLPIAWDTFTNITINFAGSAFFPNTFGQLDGNGQATAGFDSLGPLPASMLGVVMYFAYPVPDNPAWFASNDVTVTVVN